jgi:diaminohydroxyphosphoribosylaminopyrimidine deaminase/5-amino-6-(5-phosphoribosylamino)uracil reductase
MTETRQGIDAAMARAFELAALGPARGVNPRVGCVILSPDGRVLAEGYHRGAGTPHAEVDALHRLSPGDAEGATVVVSLEPCNHTGRTGPCSEALIAARVDRVVYSVADPGRVSGGGAARLRGAGVDVVAGVADDEGERLLGDWLATARLGRPLITVKWASSLDGRAAAADGSSRWITGPIARADVHRRRAAVDAIAVGTGTVIADDPELTARNDDGLFDSQPLPVVFGRSPLPEHARIRSHPRGVLTSPGTALPGELAALHARGIRSVLVEGGPRFASAVLATGLVDEVHVYLAPLLLGGPRTAVEDIGVDSIADGMRLSIRESVALGPDVLLIGEPLRSPAPSSSASSSPSSSAAPAALLAPRRSSAPSPSAGPAQRTVAPVPEGHR